MVLWVESWVSSCKSLTQWDVLGEYARATDNVPLAMDCMWRLLEWEALQGSLVQNKQQVSWAGAAAGSSSQTDLNREQGMDSAFFASSVVRWGAALCLLHVCTGHAVPLITPHTFAHA
jgi:hypothetical protein